jgi:hypothetical protein
MTSVGKRGGVKLISFDFSGGKQGRVVDKFYDFSGGNRGEKLISIMTSVGKTGERS